MAQTPQEIVTNMLGQAYAQIATLISQRDFALEKIAELEKGLREQQANSKVD